MASTVTTRLRHEAEPSKGSRFIATVVPVSNEETAKAALAEIRAEMPDAGHHCWAWRIASPSIDRASDDGEPGGSAGRPILAQLTGRDLVDTAVIVSRYWGGTKLGVGGLVRAYGGAAGEALDHAVLEPWVAQAAAIVTHEHSDTDAVVRAMSSVRSTDVDVAYAAAVTRYIEVAADDVQQLETAIADATAGRASVSFEADEG